MAAESTIEPSTDERISDDEQPLGLWIVHTPDAAALGRCEELDRDRVLPLGREVSGGGVCVRDAALSRLHARVTWDARYAQYRLGDAGSANGCFVNGRRVQTTTLRPGDVIRLGDTLLVADGPDRMAALRERADAVAPSNLNVLLLGPTGVGKEVLARRIHERSGRDGPFEGINCAAIPRELVGSELFGHERGAFSGAATDRKGLFLTAGDGTVFLDEVAELRGDVQAVLLRALQERTVRPVGSDREVPFTARIISATNATLDPSGESTAFRQDLFARLAEVKLELPPLAERRREVIELMTTFLREAGATFSPTPDAAEALLLYGWPHNVRELEALARQCAAVRSEDGEPVLDLPRLEALRSEVVEPLSLAREEDDSSEASVPPAGIDRDALKAALSEASGNVAAAARALGRPRSFVYRWMRALGLSAEDYR